MNSTYICIIIFLLLFWMEREEQKKALLARRVVFRKKKNKEGKANMLEAVARYIGKECVISTLNAQVTGTIQGICEGWLLVENSQGVESLNLDYIVRIRPYPLNKKGKKKAIISD